MNPSDEPIELTHENLEILNEAARKMDQLITGAALEQPQPKPAPAPIKAPRKLRRQIQLQERRELKRLVKQASREQQCTCDYHVWLTWRLAIGQPMPEGPTTKPSNCRRP